MSETLKSVTVYASFVEAIDGVCKTEAEKGRIYTAIMHYALFDKTPELPPLLSSIFLLMKPSIDKSKVRKTAGAKRKQIESKLKANAEQNESKTKAKQDVCLSSDDNKKIKQNGSDISNDNNSPSSSTSSSTSLCSTFSYPQSIDDVMAIAEKAGCIIGRKDAEKYFLCRMSADWVDAAGRKIAANRIVFDLKKWVLNTEKAQTESGKQQQREVNYEPDF